MVLKGEEDDCSAINKVETLKKHILATRVSPYINKSVRVLTRGLGISISEYLRNLILQDLDSRKMFEDELKKAVEQTDEEEVEKTPLTKSLMKSLLEEHASPLRRRAELS